MSNIEEQFFKVFGIESYDRYLTCEDNLEGSCKQNCEICDKSKDVFCYPQITSDILLKLICIYIGYERIYIGTFEVDHFKRFMLASLIDLYKEMRNVNKKERIKHQVQSLFSEVEE